MKLSIQMNGTKVTSLHSLPNQILDQVQDQYGTNLKMLPQADKAEIVRNLDNAGFLTLRNAVNILSRRLAVSRVCIYNWINGSRRGNLSN